MGNLHFHIGLNGTRETVNTQDEAIKRITSEVMGYVETHLECLIEDPADSDNPFDPNTDRRIVGVIHDLIIRDGQIELTDYENYAEFVTMLYTLKECKTRQCKPQAIQKQFALTS